VVVDIHQDGFSRQRLTSAGTDFLAGPCRLAARPQIPNNTARCKHWVVLMATDPTTHKSFDDF